MNDNNQNTQLLQNLIFNFEALQQKGEIATFNKDEFEQLIQYYKNNNNSEKALEIVDLAIEQYQYITDFYLVKADLLLQNHNPDDALDYIDHCEDISPYSFEIKLLKAKALSMLGRTDEVVSLLNELKSFSRLNYSVEFSIIYSYLAEFAGDYESMYYHSKDALVIDPLNFEALDRMRNASLMSRKYEESLAFHTDLINETPYNYLAWYNMGRIYSALSEYDNAIECLEYSFIINPEFEHGYIEYGDLCMLTGNYLKASTVYHEYLEKFEGDSDIYANLVQCNLKLKNLKQAKLFAYSSIKMDPFNDEAYYLLGVIYKKIRNWQKALNAFQKAMDLDEDREEYIDGVAEMYLKLKDYKKAEQYYDLLVDTCTPEEKYYIKYILYLLKHNKYNKAKQVIKISEDAAYSPLFSYLEALIKFRQNNKKEALLSLDNAISESKEDCKQFFKWAPELKFDKDVISVINYYK
ncbi:MAG: tetratricopeptide repeat protein [Deltaproteobacteria bacterium]